MPTTVPVLHAGKEFLELIDDIDALLGTNVNFMAGKWIGMARSIPAEVGVYDKEAADWLEFDNFRTLITTWGARENADVGLARLFLPTMERPVA